MCRPIVSSVTNLRVCLYSCCVNSKSNTIHKERCARTDRRPRWKEWTARETGWVRKRGCIGGVGSQRCGYGFVLWMLTFLPLTHTYAGAHRIWKRQEAEPQEYGAKYIQL